MKRVLTIAVTVATFAGVANAATPPGTADLWIQAPDGGNTINLSSISETGIIQLWMDYTAPEDGELRCMVGMEAGLEHLILDGHDFEVVGFGDFGPWGVGSTFYRHSRGELDEAPHDGVPDITGVGNLSYYSFIGQADPPSCASSGLPPNQGAMLLDGIIIHGVSDTGSTPNRVFFDPANPPSWLEATFYGGDWHVQEHNFVLGTGSSEDNPLFVHVGPPLPLGACCDDETATCTTEYEANCDGRFIAGAPCEPDPFDPPCGEYQGCVHTITMWDAYGDGWQGGWIDVYLCGELVLAGVTLVDGSGPLTVYFEACTCDEIEIVWHSGGSPHECSYCIYDAFGCELGCDGLGGTEPTGITVPAECEPPTGACCMGYDGCAVMTQAGCDAVGGVYLGDDTDCGDMHDCDADGMTDLCALVAGLAEDCNDNDIPDNCDIAQGTSKDCQPDGIPDECQLRTLPPCCGDGYCVEGESYETCPDDCPLAATCEHSITMWDDYGDGWNGGYIDVYVDGELVLAGVTLASGAGPEAVYFEAAADHNNEINWTPGGSPHECSYCIYDGFGVELGCDGHGGVEPTGFSFTGNCEEGSGARELDLLISQLPNQSNGIFSDCDCDLCPGGEQVLAENFILILTEETTITKICFWGAMYPADLPAPSDWLVNIYEDEGGYAGAEILAWEGAAVFVDYTGIVLFGVHELLVCVNLSPPLKLAPGIYHLAIYTDSFAFTDSWFWETGDFDSEAGVMGQGSGLVCPPEFPDYDSSTDMAFEVYGFSGPPINDCNENGVPDECDVDCNNNCIPDDCEDEPVACGDLDLKPGSCPNSFNRGSHGVLPVALLASEFFDLSQVDISSVRLWRADGVGAEVAPHEGPPGPGTVFEDVATPFEESEVCECADLNGDGIDDLSMKFKTDDVVAALELEDLPAGALVELVLTGCMIETDPQCFTSPTDCLRLVPPGTGGALLSVESSVAGAWVDVNPVDETLDGGGFADFVRSMPATTVVTLTAEEWAQGRPLRGWQIGGLLHHMGQTSVEFAVDQDMTVRAVYGPTPSGSPKPPSEMTPDEMAPDEMAPEPIQGQSAESGTIDRR